VIAYIALGSNLNDRRKNIALGIIALEELGQLTPSPLIMESDDEAGLGPPYLNTVVRLETQITDPCVLLEECLRIELANGRDRTLPPGSARTLDIDLITVEECCGVWEWDSPKDLMQVATTLTLILPHPRAGHRDFVREPLCRIGGRL
jgi:2-amino-4-hydroxy-6-hydroxymethyldihydropteridine diphosphokinase